MEAKRSLEKLEESKCFKDWKKKNKDNYLSYMFCLIGMNKEENQVGYYNKKKNLVTAFDVMNDVKICAEEEPFKKDDDAIKELSLGKITLDFADAIKIVESIQKEKYPNEKPIEIIAILQELDPFGTIFNVTHVTQSFKTLNVKINAENSDIVHEELVSIIQFPDKGKQPKK